MNIKPNYYLYKLNPSFLQILMSIFLVTLSACGGDSGSSAVTGKTTIKIPTQLQKLTVAQGGELHAFITIDDQTQRIEMAINSTGGGSASATLNGLTRGAHDILITYEYTDNNGTITLAEAFKSVDLSSGDGSLAFEEIDYRFDFDTDGDGVNNASELLNGTSPSISQAPLVASAGQLILEPGKAFRFEWTDVNDATFYRILENSDGRSGFVQVGSDVPQGVQSLNHIVPLYLRVNARYILQSCNGRNNGNVNSINCIDSNVMTVEGQLVRSVGYFKASNTGNNDQFGRYVSLSANGTTLAVGASGEASNGVRNGSVQNNNSTPGAGAVYIFRRLGNNIWRQQAYIKASNADRSDRFSYVRLSNNGNTLAVAATGESSPSREINAGAGDNLAQGAGAVYVFTRDRNTWSQQAYIKAINTDELDEFGSSLSLSGNGNTLAVGARNEDSRGVGVSVNRNSGDNSVTNSGAVYTYTRRAGEWFFQAYIKAGNTGANDEFGNSVSLSGNGLTLAVGALREDSSAVGVNSPVNQNNPNNAAPDSGAVYVFSFNQQNGWQQQAYIKASNTGAADLFGLAVSMSANGNTLAVSAADESSATITNQNDDTSSKSGAVYVFTRDTVWTQQVYIKAGNIQAGDRFGIDLSLSGDGNLLAVGAQLNDSGARGINGAPGRNVRLGADSGAAYIFDRKNGWAQQAFIKASNTEPGKFFGSAVSLSRDGNSLVVSDFIESNNSKGVNGDQKTPVEAPNSGAVYLY